MLIKKLFDDLNFIVPLMTQYLIHSYGPEIYQIFTFFFKKRFRKVYHCLNHVVYASDKQHLQQNLIIYSGRFLH